jgi:hypothetical protein
VGRYAARHHAGVRWHWRCPVSRTFWDTFGASAHRADRQLWRAPVTMAERRQIAGSAYASTSPRRVLCGRGRTIWVLSI